MKTPILHRIQEQRGVTLLPLVFVIVSVLALIGLTIGTSSFFEALSGAAVEQSLRAQEAALAGAHDALIKLAHDRTFAPGTYTVTTLTNASASVTVTTEADSAFCANLITDGRNVTIRSTGTSGSKTREVKVNGVGGDGAAGVDWVKCNGDFDEANMIVSEPTS